MENLIKLGKSPILLIDGHHGVYVPKILAEYIIEGSVKVKNKEHITYELGDLGNPENEFYWDSMNDIMGKVILLDIDGNEYYLEYGDGGDLWAVPEGMNLYEEN